MEGFKGTPGKWVVDGDYDVTTEDGTVISWTSQGVFEPDEIIANSKLIAAAPELLEALQKIKDMMDSFRYLADRVGMNDADGFYLGHTQGLSEKAGAAIKKALGQ